MKHGVTGWETHKCRCETCNAAIVEKRKKNKASHAKWMAKNPEYTKKYAAANRDAFKKYKSDWASRHPEKWRIMHREADWRRSGIKMNNEEYISLLNQQDYRCAVCGRELAEDKSKMNGNNVVAHVDHVHKTGKVRGLLCGSCNRAAGLLMDSASRAEKMAVYLGQHHGGTSNV